MPLPRPIAVRDTARHAARHAARATALAVGVSAAVFAACSNPAPTGSTKPLNLPYGVIYGQATTGNNSTAVLISGQAYLDSASALARDSAFGGFTPIETDAEGKYITTVVSEVPRKVYFNIEALSARPAGADTVYAVPVELDSIGGTPPHDSIQINFQLP
jgi:hypothetical protein